MDESFIRIRNYGFTNINISIFNMKKIFFLFLTFQIALSLHLLSPLMIIKAQTAEYYLNGQVIDWLTNNPIGNATIQIWGVASNLPSSGLRLMNQLKCCILMLSEYEREKRKHSWEGRYQSAL
jgi:hypothetical protein